MKKVLGIFAFSCVWVPLGAAEARVRDHAVVVRSLVKPAAGGIALGWAVAGARQRLEQSACRGLFAEYSDASGHTLQENLDAMAETGDTYLALVLFADGTGRPTCKAGGAFAVTAPGSRVVYICGRKFRDLAERSPATAEAVVIHELLHSLGLGENPPSSSEITTKVLARCQS
jgi:hypothetical protein